MKRCHIFLSCPNGRNGKQPSCRAAECQKHSALGRQQHPETVSSSANRRDDKSATSEPDSKLCFYSSMTSIFFPVFSPIFFPAGQTRHFRKLRKRVILKKLALGELRLFTSSCRFPKWTLGAKTFPDENGKSTDSSPYWRLLKNFFGNFVLCWILIFLYVDFTTLV